MEEMTIEERPGMLSKLMSRFVRQEEIEEEETVSSSHRDQPTTLRPSYRYTITVRRQITSFDDAVAAAHGLKRGEQQILNLAMTDPMTRQKIVDFMCGVNFSEEGTWEEVGQDIYLIVPSNAHVEVAPPSPRMAATRN
ncbi:cell division protein SepF [bacterium]|nr:MAG: cell division protein SepF [bacterium]